MSVDVPVVSDDGNIHSDYFFTHVNKILKLIFALALEIKKNFCAPLRKVSFCKSIYRLQASLPQPVQARLHDVRRRGGPRLVPGRLRRPAHLRRGAGQGPLRHRVVGPRLRAEGLPRGLRQSVGLHRLDQGHRRAFCGIKLSAYGLVILAVLNDAGITQPYSEKFALQ